MIYLWLFAPLFYAAKKKTPSDSQGVLSSEQKMEMEQSSFLGAVGHSSLLTQVMEVSTIYGTTQLTL